ncbi:MAG: hypothetical protein HQL08_09445 [Nitrospirae bacterium]|nr:hypothetical protein [Nitrospirota bacterium]
MDLGNVTGAITSFLSQGDDLSIPFGQVMIFVVVNSFCLLFARYKLGLLITYSFVLFWGFISNREYFVDHFGKTTWGMVVYALAGLAMVIIFIIGFSQGDKD